MPSLNVASSLFLVGLGLAGILAYFVGPIAVLWLRIYFEARRWNRMRAAHVALKAERPRRSA